MLSTFRKIAILSLLLSVHGFATVFETDFREGRGLGGLKREGAIPEVISLSLSEENSCLSALRFQLRIDTVNRKNIRSEVRLPSEKEPAKTSSRHREWSYHFSLWFPANFATDTLPEIVAQWRFWDWEIRKGIKTTGSPQVSLQVRNDSLWVEILSKKNLPDQEEPEHQPGYIWLKTDSKTLLPLGPLEKEKWLNFDVQVRWSTREDGLFRLSINDEIKLTHRGANTYKGKHTDLPYFKTGIYKWPWKKKSLFDHNTAVQQRELFLRYLKVSPNHRPPVWSELCK